MSKVVMVVQVSVTRDQLEEVLEVLRENDVYEDEAAVLLPQLKTKAVLANPELLKYLCEGIVEAGGAFDPEEWWNDDQFADWKDFVNVTGSTRLTTPGH